MEDFKVVDQMCYADFLAYYVLDRNDYDDDKDNDWQPKILQSDTANDEYRYHKPLITSNDI